MWDYFTMKDYAVTPDPNEEENDIFYCFTCNQWLNNCLKKRNNATFILLMVFVFLMITIEGGTAIAIFFRYFVAKKGMEISREGFM
ncbi:hypothetical protein YC2023_103012 [Brassica napus]